MFRAGDSGSVRSADVGGGRPRAHATAPVASPRRDDVHRRAGFGDRLPRPQRAGKTTTMRAIFGLTALDAGAVRFDGRPIDHTVRRRFGYLPEERGLYPTMRVLEQLRYLGQLRGLPAAKAEAEAKRWLAELEPRRASRRRAGGPLARQPAAGAADRRADPRTRRARARRAVLRPRPGRRRRPLQGARRRGPTRRDGAVLVAPARPRRGPVRARRGRRPRPCRCIRHDRRPHGRHRPGAGDRRPDRPRRRVGDRPRWRSRSSVSPTGGCA